MARAPEIRKIIGPDKMIVNVPSEFTAQFTIGDIDNITQIVWYVYKGYNQESGQSINLRDSTYDPNTGVWTLQPTKLKCKSEGTDYKVELSIYSKDGFDGAKKSVISLKEPYFDVAVSPAATTIYPGESAQFTYSIKDAPPGTVSQVWYVNDVEVSKERNYKFDFKELGTYKIRCDATINVDGFGPKTKSGVASVVCARGKLDGKINIAISGVASELERGDTTYIKAVSDHPADVTASYVWKVNGVPTKVHDKNFDFKGIIIGKNQIEVVSTFEGKNYEAYTVNSPTDIFVNVTKSSSIPYEVKNAPEFSKQEWGYKGQQTWKIIPTVIDPIDSSLVYLSIKPGTTAKYYLDDVLVEESPFDSLSDGSPPVVKFGYNHKLPDFMGNHKMKVEFTTQETDNFAEYNIVSEFNYAVGKCSNWNAKGVFEIDDKLVENPVQYRVAPKDTITIKVINLIDQSGDTAYNDYHRNLGKEGTYQLVDEDGTVLASAVNGVITYEASSELKATRAKIVHTLNRTDIFDTEKTAELPVLVSTVDNPIIPPLELELVQTDTPFVNENAVLSYNILNLPEGSTHKIDYIKWFVNDKLTDSTGETLTLKAVDGLTVHAEISINVEEYTPAIIISNYAKVKFKYRTWPSLNFVLKPSATSVAWGDFLNVSCEITNKDEVIGLDDVLSIGKPHWYLDGKEVASLEDNSFRIRATNPGKHTVKAEIEVSHSEYEPKTLKLEQSLEITTEKRQVEITSDIEPKDYSVKIGENARFNAIINGAPPDSSTSFKWTVNDEAQKSADNFVDYKADSIGEYAVKYTSTTKTPGADDVVLNTSTKLTVENRTMDAKVEIKANSLSINMGESYSASATVTGAPEGSTIAYNWNTGETTPSVSKVVEKSGTVKLSCTVTIKADGYDDFVITSNELSITVNKIVLPGVKFTMTAVPPTIKIGESAVFTANVEAPEGSTIAYKWDTGETTNEIEVVGETEGFLERTIEVTVSHPDYLDFKTSSSISVKVEKKEPEIPEECPVIYVHPLPHRSTAYIWCGWWVMDAIEKLTLEGKDWKTSTSEDSPYYCHLNVLSKMLTDYPEVDVQESRNGRIVHRSALEVGIIY